MGRVQALDIPSSADTEFLGREPTLYGRPHFEAITSAQVGLLRLSDSGLL